MAKKRYGSSMDLDTHRSKPNYDDNKHQEMMHEEVHPFKDPMRMRGKTGGMLYEDRSKPSNCPTEVIMSEYPRTGYLPQDYDDTIYGIDKTIDQAVRTAAKYGARKKY